MSILEHTTKAHAVPSFAIYDAMGKKVDTLKHCFIKRIVLDTVNPPAIIRGSNGWMYTAVYDSRLSPPTNSTEVEVIISFQAHTYGNFAIIRQARSIEPDSVSQQS